MLGCLGPGIYEIYLYRNSPNHWVVRLPTAAGSRRDTCDHVGLLRGCNLPTNDYCCRSRGHHKRGVVAIGYLAAVCADWCLVGSYVSTAGFRYAFEAGRVLRLIVDGAPHRNYDVVVARG